MGHYTEDATGKPKLVSSTKVRKVKQSRLPDYRATDPAKEQLRQAGAIQRQAQANKPVNRRPFFRQAAQQPPPVEQGEPYPTPGLIPSQEPEPPSHICAADDLATMGSCVECGKGLPSKPSRRGPQQKYCSPSCRQRCYDRKKLEKKAQPSEE